MKKRFSAILCTFLAMVISCTLLFSGCFGKDKPEDDTPKEYTIQYTDGVGTHQITVTAGMPYSIETIPEKIGYTFTGLYDAETGGTQYVSASGASLSPFTDGKNMTLFPQFKANEYTVILDYQGAAVTGSRQLTVSYGSSLPELPKNLTLEHKEFTGWYTKANGEGVQVADEYGLVPLVSVINETNFDLSGKNINLYAGFETEKVTVTCCFEAGIDTEDMQVEYDTPVSKIVPKTRVNGNAPLTWSKTQGGEVFNGKITDDTVLYAVEYAPVIELDSNGGDKVIPVVARAGSTISLPTPTKDLAKFAYWEDMQGNEYTSTTMPQNSISLKAVWQAKLVFDENGGSDVDDISVTAGNKVTLPMPEKEGFIFAGWYTVDKEQYTSTTMPSLGVALKAGWYKENEDTFIIYNATAYKYWSRQEMYKPSTSNGCYELNMTKYTSGENINVKIDFHMSCKAFDDSQLTLYVDFYSQKQVSSVYFIKTATVGTFTNSSYSTFTFTESFNIKSNFYMMFYTSKQDISYVRDFYYTVHYPDTTTLYI